MNESQKPNPELELQNLRTENANLKAERDGLLTEVAELTKARDYFKKEYGKMCDDRGRLTSSIDPNLLEKINPADLKTN